MTWFNWNANVVPPKVPSTHINSMLVDEAQAERWTVRALARIDIVARINVFKELIPDDVKNVLEVGCGSGYNLLALNCINQKLELTGVDILDYAIKQATERVKKAAIIVRANALYLPFSKEFDLVMACGYLDWIKVNSVNQAVNEIVRVSRKYILVIDYTFTEEMKGKVNEESEVIVKNTNGATLYMIREYVHRFSGLKLIKHVAQLPEDFSSAPMSAWLFSKE